MRGENVAVIPARGGSKGLPKKNIKHLCGKPLIVHTIEQALNAKTIDRVVVSTDCQEIARIAEDNGASVIMRPIEISGDFASSEDALIHVVKELEKLCVYIECVVFLQCTSPIRKSFDIEKTLSLVTSDKFDSALSVVANHKFLWRKGEGDQAVPVNYDPKNRKMRQNIEEFQENGSVYVCKASKLLDTKCRLNGRIGLHVMEEKSGYEIDSACDFAVIEKLMGDY